MLTFENCAFLKTKVVKHFCQSKTPLLFRIKVCARVCLSLSLSVFLCLSVSLSLSQCSCLSLSVFLSVCLSASLPLCLSAPASVVSACVSGTPTVTGHYPPCGHSQLPVLVRSALSPSRLTHPLSRPCPPSPSLPPSAPSLSLSRRWNRRWNLARTFRGSRPVSNSTHGI